jgi:hypothetical protein|eukprot:30696-Pelagococcus_subviridis.AAC.4
MSLCRRQFLFCSSSSRSSLFASDLARRDRMYGDDDASGVVGGSTARAARGDARSDASATDDAR